MEEKTPVGSNAPIEESTEKKTSPAGSSSPSAAPAGSNSPSAAPIEGTSDVVDTASADASSGRRVCPCGEQFAFGGPCGEQFGFAGPNRRNC